MILLVFNKHIQRIPIPKPDSLTDTCPISLLDTLEAYVSHHIAKALSDKFETSQALHPIFALTVSRPGQTPIPKQV